MREGNNILLALSLGIVLGLFIYERFFQVRCECNYIPDDFKERIKEILEDENFKKDVPVDSIYHGIIDRLRSSY